MKHNQLNLIPGDIVCLDREKPNRSKVMIVRMSPNNMFSRVVPAHLKEPTDKDAWDVMTCRLSNYTTEEWDEMDGHPYPGHETWED